MVVNIVIYARTGVKKPNFYNFYGFKKKTINRLNWVSYFGPERVDIWLRIYFPQL